MDRRERASDWFTFDERRMVLELETVDGDVVTVPARFDVCGTCDGRGAHVNPSIDSHGLTRDDFAADPDFADEYFGGAYDVTCNECNGRRVSPVVDEIRATAEQIAAWETAAADAGAAAIEREHEIRMGY